MAANSRRNTLILVATMLVTVVLYVLLYWMPHNRQMARMQADIVDKRLKIDEQRLKLAQLPALHSDLALLETINRQMTERVPESINVREFVAAIYEMGERRGVSITSVTPQIATHLVTFQQQPVTLTLGGRFHAIVELLHELETTEHLVELTDIEVKPTAKPGETQGSLEVKVDVRLFARPIKPRLLSQTND